MQVASWKYAESVPAGKRESSPFSAEYTGIRETIGQAVSGVYAQAEDKNITIMVEAFEDRKLYHNPKWTAEATWKYSR